MNFLKCTKALAFSLGTFGMVCPPSLLTAAEPTPVAQIQANPEAERSVDVVLAAPGTLVGTVIDVSAERKANEPVVLLQGQQEIARSRTNDEGEFAFRGVRPGTYHIKTAAGAGMFRVWSTDAAPPAAKKQAVVVVGRPLVRGQASARDLVTLTALGATIATVTITAINISETNDLEDEIAQIPKSN